MAIFIIFFYMCVHVCLEGYIDLKLSSLVSHVLCSSFVLPFLSLLLCLYRFMS